MKDEKKIICCNYQFSNNKILLDPNINHSFCEKCGSILIKSETGNIYYTVKSKQKKRETEFSPIEVIKSMKKKTEEDYPFLNEDFNINNNEKDDKENIINSINIYLKHRDFILSCLQKIMNILDFSDLIFYQCLFFIDTYLSHTITEEMTEKIILYYLVGYFLIAAKSKENDYDPNLEPFCHIKKGIYLNIAKIVYYETLCLKTIKYNIFSYSAYEWISELSFIGFVFDCEINKDSEIIVINGHRHLIINTIYKYCMKLLLNLTIKKIFIKYSPMYISFSLIQISREKFIDINYINNNLYNTLLNLYGISFEDYKKCYEEIKNEIDQNDDIIFEIYNKENLKEINHNNENYDSCKNLNINKKSIIQKTNASSKMESTDHIMNLKTKSIKSKFIENKNNIIINEDNKLNLVDVISNSENNKENDSSSNNKENNINDNKNYLNNNENKLKYKEKSINDCNNFLNEENNNNTIYLDNDTLNNDKSNIKLIIKNLNINKNIIKNNDNDEININSNSNKEDDNNELKKIDKEESLDDNIIVYDEKTPEKNNEIYIPKLDFIENNTTTTIKPRNRLKKKYITSTNERYKNTLFINKKINEFKSNTNLPNIYNSFDKSYLYQKNANNSKSIDKNQNIFLKTNIKSNNQIKIHKTIYSNTFDKRKKYVLNITHSSKKECPKKDILDSVKKSLFFDNLNKKKHSIDILNMNGKFKLSNLIPNLAMSYENFKNIKLKNNSISKGNKSMSKKKIKSYQLYKLPITSKRNQSNKQLKKIDFRTNFFKNLEIENIFNIKRKNK